jgi:hypothetical protein
VADRPVNRMVSFTADESLIQNPGRERESA